MELEQDGSITEEHNRILTIRGKEYDLTDRPLLWYPLLFVFSAIFVGLAYVFVMTAALIIRTIGNSVAAVPSIVWKVLVAGILVWFACGLIKLYFTGSSEPFFSVEVSYSSSNEEEKEGGE